MISSEIWASLVSKALVLHSGGMDSSLCLALAVDRFGVENVTSVGFCYGQRHSSELTAAGRIAEYFQVQRTVIDLPALPGWEVSSLINSDLAISQGDLPNSFVVGRNGLFLMMCAPLIKLMGIETVYVGVMELEGANSGYPDCSRAYIDSVESVIRRDIQNASFEVATPLVQMTKLETLLLADSLGVLDFLLQETVTCYEGIALLGCRSCPACLLRNEAVEQFYQRFPEKIKEPFNTFLK